MYFVPSTWKRISAYLIDQILITVSFVPLWTYYWYHFLGEEIQTLPGFLFFIYTVVWPFFYEFFFLSWMFATPGQWLLGLKVIEAKRQNTKLQPVQILIYAIAHRMTLFFSIAPYCLAFFKYDRTHLVDWLAETRVVQLSPRSSSARLRVITGLILTVLFFTEGVKKAPVMVQKLLASEVEWQSLMPSSDEYE